MVFHTLWLAIFPYIAQKGGNFSLLLLISFLICLKLWENESKTASDIFIFVSHNVIALLVFIFREEKEIKIMNIADVNSSLLSIFCCILRKKDGK